MLDLLIAQAAPPPPPPLELLALSLVADLVALFLMYYVLYFRRHWRTDILLAYCALNIGVFMTMVVLTTAAVSLAAGFGLFGILSIIRIQGDRVTAQEMGYYFIALVLGLVNGLGFQSHDLGLVVAMNVVLLLVVLAVDCKPLRDRSQHMDVTLEGVYTTPGGAGCRAREQARWASALLRDQQDRPDPWPHGHRRAAAAAAGRHRAASAEVAQARGGWRRTGAVVGSGRPRRAAGGLELRRPTR